MVLDKPYSPSTAPAYTARRSRSSPPFFGVHGRRPRRPRRGRGGVAGTPLARSAWSRRGRGSGAKGGRTSDGAQPFPRRATRLVGTRAISSPPLRPGKRLRGSPARAACATAWLRASEHRFGGALADSSWVRACAARPSDRPEDRSPSRLLRRALVPILRRSAGFGRGAGSFGGTFVALDLSRTRPQGQRAPMPHARVGAVQLQLDLAAAGTPFLRRVRGGVPAVEEGSCARQQRPGLQRAPSHSRRTTSRRAPPPPRVPASASLSCRR